MFTTAEHLLAIVDAIPTAIVMTNEEGRITLVNSQTEALFGYSRTQILNEPLEILIPARFRLGHPKLRQDYLEHAVTRPMGSGRDLYGLRQNGTEFPIEIGLNPINTKDGLFVLSAIVDITERKKLEARFRATIESAPTAMVMIDQVGTLVLVNSEAENIFGYNQDELLGKKVEVLVPSRFSHHHPEQRTNFFMMPKARRMGEGRELFAAKKCGDEFPVEIGLNPVQTDEGSFVLAAIVDLTERNRSLEQLRQANEALESSNLELQQFAYVASHDLQTPLRSVAGFAQCLQEDYEDKLSDEANEYIKRMVGATERMQELISNLLDYSRIDSSPQAFKAVDLNDVLNDALNMLNIDSDDSVTVNSIQLPTVPGVKSQLMQLFMNIIGNGIKYASSKNAIIDIKCEDKGDKYEMIITDNGIGIAPQYHEQVFEIFRRLHTKQEYPGTGIGLAICRKIVHKHGGAIWIDPKESMGTSFKFTLLKGGVNLVESNE